MDMEFLGEVNPISMIAGLLGGVIVFAMMGYAGNVGMMWRILGLIGGAVAGFLVFNTVISRG